MPMPILLLVLMLLIHTLALTVAAGTLVAGLPRTV